jgi:hypothetical protein
MVSKNCAHGLQNFTFTPYRFVYELKNTTMQPVENAEGADLKNQKLKKP